MAFCSRGSGINIILKISHSFCRSPISEEAALLFMAKLRILIHHAIKFYATQPVVLTKIVGSLCRNALYLHTEPIEAHLQRLL